MGDGLDPAAHEVEVGDRQRIEDREARQSLGRDVHHPLPVERRRADEEQMLGTDEGLVPRVERLEYCTHGILRAGSENLASEDTLCGVA